MFKCNYKNLRLSFNKFHNIDKKDMPEYDEFCLLELKNGDYTAGKWHQKKYEDRGKSIEGQFGRGLADTIPVEDVSKWHSLDHDDLSNCLEKEEINWINIGEEGEGIYSVVFNEFKSFADGDFPKKDQYCLLIMTDGGLGAGRWNPYRNTNDGSFIYASALASYSMKKVWAWKPLSPDYFFNLEEEKENERKHEEELNKNPLYDPEKFKYGKDIDVYYEKALEKLKEEYPWATMKQMKKKKKWEIVPCHGRYVFGQYNESYDGSKIVKEWENEGGADEFIDFLCEYSKEKVKNSNPEEKFKYGMDIEVYLEKAYKNVKKDYRWLDKKMLKCRYSIEQIDGDWEFVKRFDGYSQHYVCDCPTAESFIESVEYGYQDAALWANPTVSSYDVPFGHVEIHGWNLESYRISKLKSGDYKACVTAGDRSTGGSRDFFITPYCFEAKTYEEFLDRYLEIVPSNFGLDKKDLLPNKDLKKFLGY